MDHGAANPTAWHAWAVDHDSNLIVFDEYYSPGRVSEHAPEILRRRRPSPGVSRPHGLNWWERRNDRGTSSSAAPVTRTRRSAPTTVCRTSGESRRRSRPSTRSRDEFAVGQQRPPGGLHAAARADPGRARTDCAAVVTDQRARRLAAAVRVLDLRAPDRAVEVGADRGRWHATRARRSTASGSPLMGTRLRAPATELFRGRAPSPVPVNPEPEDPRAALMWLNTQNRNRGAQSRYSNV